MRKIIFVVFFSSISSYVFAQQTKQDSLVPILIQEIIVIGKKTTISEKQSKPLTSIDDYLQKSAKVDMIKRGAYAWEPIINSMQQKER